MLKIDNNHTNLYLYIPLIISNFTIQQKKINEVINHRSPYGQTLRFNSSYYLTISDEKLAEIEQNCANIDKEVITIGGSDGYSSDIDSDEDNSIEE